MYSIGEIFGWQDPVPSRLLIGGRNSVGCTQMKHKDGQIGTAPRNCTEWWGLLCEPFHYSSILLGITLQGLPLKNSRELGFAHGWGIIDRGQRKLKGHGCRSYLYV